MAENLKKAQCTDEEFAMAREAGLFVATSADEQAVHAFAEAVKAQVLKEINEEQQVARTADDIAAAERLIDALDSDDGTIEAEAGEFGDECRAIGHALALAVERRASHRGCSDADLIAALNRAADELIQNRGPDYWDRIAEQRARYALPSIQPALAALTIRPEGAQ